jgi:hypothetical protein
MGAAKPMAGWTAHAVWRGVALAPRAAGVVLRTIGQDEVGRQQTLERVLNSEEAAAIARIVAGSAALDELLRHLPANDGLWNMIDLIAASPSVRSAVARQGVGFAGEVGLDVRTRARLVDDRIERAARSVGRGRARPAPAKADPAETDPGDRP